MEQSILYSGRVFRRLIDESRPAWHCLRTQPRQDGALARELAQDGLRVFAPIARTAGEYGRSWANANAPVFPDFVFVFTTGSIVSAVAADRRVREVVPLHGAVPTSVKDMTETRARELLGIGEPEVLEPTGPFSRHDMPSSGSWTNL